jgi:alcohol dehydrogenase YqhD (iron-dependent ADH family)
MAREKAEQEKMIMENIEEHRAYFHELGLKTEKKNHRIAEEEARLKVFREVEWEKKRERKSIGG